MEFYDCWVHGRRPIHRESTSYILVAIVTALVIKGAAFDEYTACMRPVPRSSPLSSPMDQGDSLRGHGGLYGRPVPTPPPPCDFMKQSWCAVPGSGYPWHAVRQFVHENQGLMRRMYGEVRQISVLQAELSSNEVAPFDTQATGRAETSDGYDLDFHTLREAAVVKYTVPIPVKTKAVKIRKGVGKRGGEVVGGKLSESGSKAVDGGLPKSVENGGKIDEVRIKEGGKTQNAHASTDKGTKVPVPTTAEVEDTIWQSDSSLFEVPTTMAATTSSESSSVSSSENPETLQYEDSSKKYDFDGSDSYETTTLDVPGSTYVNHDMTVASYKDGSMTPEMGYTTTPYSQSNFFSPTVLSSTSAGTVSPSSYEQAAGTKTGEYHQEKLFQDAVKEEKEGEEELIHEMMEDEGMLMEANASINEEISEADEENVEKVDNLEDISDKDGSEVKGEEEESVFPSGQRIPPSKLRGVNACPVKEEVVAPFWANNTRGEILALLNLYPFEQYVHWEKCTYEHRQMFCREGCRCEQQYRLHRLLAYDPRNECRGIFSDWFKFPSCCVCMCYNIPSELRHTSRSPRNHHEDSSTETSPLPEEEANYRKENDYNDEVPSQGIPPLTEETLEVKLLEKNVKMDLQPPKVKPLNTQSDTRSGSTNSVPVDVVTPLHFYYYYNQHQMNNQAYAEQGQQIPSLPLQKNARFSKELSPTGV